MEIKEYVNELKQIQEDKYAEYEIDVHYIPMGSGAVIEDAPSMTVKIRPYLTEDEYMALCSSIALSWFKADYDKDTDTANISDFKTQFHTEMQFEALLEFYTDIDTDTLSSEDISFLYWNTDLYKQMTDIIMATQSLIGHCQLDQLEQVKDDAYDLMDYYRESLLNSKDNAGDDMISAAAQIFYLIVDMLDKLDDFVGSISDTLMVDGQLDNNVLAQMLSGITNSKAFKDLLKVFVFDDNNKNYKNKDDKGEAKTSAKTTKSNTKMVNKYNRSTNKEK